MKNLGIIQPGRLGDIIICLPIAKHYSELGYKVFWPVFDKYINNFLDTIDYVHFLPTVSDIHTCVPQAKGILFNYEISKVVDLAATFPGSMITEEYDKSGSGLGFEKFDEFKYRMAEVPFEKKWTLEYKRDLKAEDELYKKYVKSDKYDVVSLTHSKGKVNKQIESKYQLIEMNEKHNIFHWRKILENAQSICLVDSAVSNFVEQINISGKKIMIKKYAQPLPVYKNNWKLILE